VSRILVVEDDPAILRGLAETLRRETYDVLLAADGETGYRLVREKDPDLLILDLMLPKLSGYEICRKMRSEGLRTPILILTARGDEGDRVLGLDLGADDYVSKPFSLRELLARVRALLRRVQATGSLLNELRVNDVFVDFRSYEARKGGARLAIPLAPTAPPPGLAAPSLRSGSLRSPSLRFGATSPTSLFTVSVIPISDSFPTLYIKLTGGRCLTIIGTEGGPGGARARSSGDRVPENLEGGL
jgi:CheY-like chemotaxis protein